MKEIYNTPLNPKKLFVLATLGLTLIGCAAKAKLNNLERYLETYDKPGEFIDGKEYYNILNESGLPTASFDDRLKCLNFLIENQRQKAKQREAEQEKQYSKKFDDAIIDIESNGKPWKVNPTSNATGLMQVTQGVVDEYNQFHKTNYSLEDMKNPNLNVKVGKWTFKRIRKHYLPYFGIKDSLENVAIAYNAGLSRAICYAKRKCKLPEETKNYLTKLKDRGITKLPRNI